MVDALEDGSGSSMSLLTEGRVIRLLVSAMLDFS